MAAGLAALVLAMMIGRRAGFAPSLHKPHNIPFVMLGAALLWFGWFGFNGGAAGSIAEGGLIWVNTLVAPGAALVAWLFTEQLRDGRMTSVGAASGIVAGLVAITPACGSVSPVGALFLGLVAGGLSASAIGLKYRFKIDDSLDVVGVHLVSGLWGTVAIGLVAKDSGLFYGHDYKQLAVQTVIALVALVFTGVLTFVIAMVLKPLGWRIDREAELTGIDSTEHAESAYEASTNALIR